MCIGGSPSIPEAAPLPPRPAPTKNPNESVDAASNQQKQQALAATGISDTKQTGALGVQTEANVKKKRLGE